MKIISLFTGAGGLDLGFKKAGYNIVWANEFDKNIYPTYIYNNPETFLDTRSIVDIDPEEVLMKYLPIDGIIGGPPCQSWSLAGSMRGLLDSRGQLVYEYLRFIKIIKPKFFLFENVPGLISKTHFAEFMNLISEFNKAGYNIQYSLLNAKDFNVAQDRKRVFIFGLRKDIDKIFAFDDIPRQPLATLQDVIGHLRYNATPTTNNKANSNLKIQNHEYYVGGFSSLYMSRNRKKQWDEQSFTIQASGRHAPLHPDSSDMIQVSQDVRVFADKDILTRRLTVKECALIQSFPNDYVFLYDSVDIGYKMIGNAVPIKLSYAIAKSIYERIFNNEY